MTEDNPRRLAGAPCSMARAAGGEASLGRGDAFASIQRARASATVITCRKLSIQARRSSVDAPGVGAERGVRGELDAGQGPRDRLEGPTERLGIRDRPVGHFIRASVPRLPSARAPRREVFLASEKLPFAASWAKKIPHWFAVGFGFHVSDWLECYPGASSSIIYGSVQTQRATSAPSHASSPIRGYPMATSTGIPRD